MVASRHKLVDEHDLLVASRYRLVGVLGKMTAHMIRLMKGCCKRHWQ